MPEVSFLSLLIVVAVAFAARFILGLLPRLKLPAVVLEILAGIALGPSGFGLVRVDSLIQVLSLIGLALLLFLAGMEIDLDRLRGPALRLAGAAFALSLGLAAFVGLATAAFGIVRSPVLVTIVLLATSLGLVIPVLKDSREVETPFGQLTIVSASIADFGAVILLSLFFSRQAASPVTQLILLTGFALIVALLLISLRCAQQFSPFSAVLLRLQDTTAEIRVRGAVLLLIAFVALAEKLGLETILGAFLAGAAIRLADRDVQMTHPNFRLKLEAIGFGFLIPVFFVTSGLQFDVRALFASAATLTHVPLFLAALLLVRAVPAVLYRRVLDTPRTVAAGLLQATSLPFIVAATRIGMDLHLINSANGAALVAAGLLSVVIFPLAALGLIGRAEPRAEELRV